MKINKQILKESLLNIIKEDYKNPTDTVVKLLQRNNLVKESIQPINEVINSQWIMALKDVVDDLQMHTEMLINERYGRDDLNTFKEKWYKITLQFDKKFGNMIKNLKR